METSLPICDETMISPTDFLSSFAGFNCVGVALDGTGVVHLLLREDYTQWTDWKDEGASPREDALEKRVAVLHADGAIVRHVLPSVRSDLNLCAAAQGRHGFLILGSRGFAASGSSSAFHVETPLVKSANGMRGGIHSVRNIHGETFACGGRRSTLRRQADGTWNGLSVLFPEPRIDEGYFAGFRDIDGFSPTDLYAVGGDGDVWRFDGEHAQRVDFPSNLRLEAVCCGSDGKAYIGGIDGCLFAGRSDAWKEIKSPKLSLPIRFMRWFDDRLWVTNDYGVWWVEGNELVPAKIPPEAKVCAGYMAINDDSLILAGHSGSVACLRNGTWEVLVDAARLYQETRADGSLRSVERARWQELRSSFSFLE